MEEKLHKVTFQLLNDEYNLEIPDKLYNTIKNSAMQANVSIEEMLGKAIFHTVSKEIEEEELLDPNDDILAFEEILH